MQWHVLMRRCPLKSFTAVGDIAQGSSASAARSWEAAFAPFVGDRLRVEELTVNYRTPRNIVQLAEQVAAANGLEITSLRTVREGDHEPIIEHCDDAAALVPAATEAVAAEHSRLGEGIIAVIAPVTEIGALRRSLQERFGKRVGTGAGSMTQDVVALTADEAKGLEFDGVVLVEPAGLLQEAGGRVGSLYVAMTRSTQSLRVITSRSLPAGF